MEATDELRIADALLKPGTVRSYEDILIIKSYVSTLDLIKSKHLTIRSEQLDYLCRAINIETFPPKACVFQKGAFADKMFIVFSGCCSIIDSSHVSDKESSNECFSGMSFGEDEILADKYRRSSAYNESTTMTQLLSIDRASYLAFLADAYDANNHPSSNSNAKSSLAFIMGVLEKPRHVRTAADIESMAAFFAREIPFFQQFRYDQLRELCLIVDVAKLWGHQLLFKQGEKGHAFYSILSGSVQVWVKNESNSDQRNSGVRSDGEADLGVLVTSLPRGVTFGEQPAAVMRQSSVTTGDGLTHLLVVDSLEYTSLLPAIQSKEALNKIFLLRKTSLFQTMDAAYLRSFSSFLQPIAYCTEQAVYTEGWTDMDKGEDRALAGPAPPLPGITIIVVGECRVDVEVKKTAFSVPSAPHFSPGKAASLGRGTKSRSCGKVTRAHLGRIGPGGVLYHFNAQDVTDEDMLHTETVTAATPVHAYTISRSDFFFRLDSDTREAVVREITRDAGALRAVTAEEWRKSEAWAGFKKAMSTGEKDKMENKNRSIIDSYRSLEGVTFTSTSQAPMPSHRRPVSPSNTDALPLVQSPTIGVSRGLVEREIVAGAYDDDIEFIKRSLGTSKSVGSSSSRGRSRTAVWPPDIDVDVATSLRIMTGGSRTDNDEVEKAIKMNKMRVGPAKHRLAFLQNRHSSPPSSPPLSSHASFSHSLLSAATYGEGFAEAEELQGASRTDGASRHSGQTKGQGQERGPVPTFPFSLIHLHRETINNTDDSAHAHETSRTRNVSNDAGGTEAEVLSGLRRRPLRCHLRLCGTMRSPEAARESAEAQIQLAMLGMRKGMNADQHSQQTRVVWRKFSGFEAIPSQHSDHFIVYCRSAPIEFGSFTPSPATGVDFLQLQFPFGCKVMDQNYACFTARQISTDDNIPISPSTADHPAKRSNDLLAKDDMAKKKLNPFPTPAALAVKAARPRSSTAPCSPSPPSALSEKKSLSWKGGGASSMIEILDRGGRTASSALMYHASIEFLVKHTVVDELRRANSRVKKVKPIFVGNLQSPLQRQGKKAAEALGLDIDGTTDLSEDCSVSSDGSWQKERKSNTLAAKGTRALSRPTADQQQDQRRRLTQPLFLMELSSFRETHATVASRTDCLAFTQAFLQATSSSNSNSSWYTCVAPLYEWLTLDESTLRQLSHQSTAPLERPSTSPAGQSALVSPAAVFGSSADMLPSNSAYHPTFGPTKDPTQPPVSMMAVAGPKKAHPALLGSSSSKGPGYGSILGFGFALGGTQEAKDKRESMLKSLIEARRGVLLAHDRLCLNEDSNRKREEKSSRFHLLPSIVCSTTESSSQYDISLAIKRRNVTKQQIKLLEALVSNIPLRTVQAQTADSNSRMK